MALICVSCRAENPIINRFCGQCGTQLGRATGNPEELRRDEALRWNTAAVASAGSNGDTGNSVDSGSAVDAAPANSGPAQPQSNYNFIIENTARTGFLGLTSSYEDDEPEPSSHLGRNIAICLMAVAVSLAGWQWRSIHNYALLLYSSISGQDESREAATGNAVPNTSARIAENSSRTLAKADEPQAVESSSDAEHARVVQQTERTLEPAATTANSSAGVTRPRAMGSPVGDVRESKSSAASNPRTKFQTTRTADPAENLPDNALGAYEMDRAAHSGNDEVRAMWLWKAVGKENPQAPIELARMYVRGSGVVRNCQQAEVLLRSAAKNGSEEAKLSLQQILLQGGCSTR